MEKCPYLKKLLSYEKECNHFSPTHFLYPGTLLEKINAISSFSFHVFLEFRNGTLECVPCTASKPMQLLSEVTISHRSTVGKGSLVLCKKKWPGISNSLLIASSCIPVQTNSWYFPWGPVLSRPGSSSINLSFHPSSSEWRYVQN